MDPKHRIIKGLNCIFFIRYNISLNKHTVQGGGGGVAIASNSKYAQVEQAECIKKGIYTNSVDKNETLQNTASHQGLRCCQDKHTLGTI